ncbi:MAG: ThiF family adenylyltransferase [Deltaproteobacteria bacterium]|nr:ThiF family adenylyltransferase [Deltaproteobacteria bacterium]
MTWWFLVVDDTYPRGNVQVLPAKDGGLDDTMPHQRRNEYGAADRPWRTGKLCLERPVAVLGMRDEELSASGRMAWHVQRAVEWLQAAATDRLRVAGERFELPELPPTSDMLAFIEDDVTLAAWNASARTHGIVELVRIDSWWRANAFDGIETLPCWGTWGATATKAVRGGWIRSPGVPVIRNWSFPSTWGELREATRAHGVTLDDHLKPLVPRLRAAGTSLLLLGAAVPQTWAGAPVEMHWWALTLPKLASQSKPPPGFRPTDDSLWLYDRQNALHDGRKISWVSTSNVAPHRRRARGSASRALTTKRVLLIGAGALGSQVAELLVRLGVQTLGVVDKEKLEAGNLARHTLTLRDVGKSKAVAVAERLSTLSATVAVKGLNCDAAASASSTDIGAFDVVIDCSADRDALDALDSLGDGVRPIHWVSLSLSMDAERLYVFTACSGRFPRTAFEEAVGPWTEKDWVGIDVDALHSEGAGCWHPLSPARADDVMATAAIAVRTLDERIEANIDQAQLTVFERRHDAGAFQGYVRV